MYVNMMRCCTYASLTKHIPTLKHMKKKFYAQVSEIHVWLNYQYDSLNMYNFNTGVCAI